MEGGICLNEKKGWGQRKVVLAMEILNNAQLCTGCGTCELICSFHHSEMFSTNFSDIHVLKSNKIGKVTWSIDPSCDFCIGEKQPLCVKYCPYGAIKFEK